MLKKIRLKTEDIAFFEKQGTICNVTVDGLYTVYPESVYALQEMPFIAKQPIDLSYFEYLGYQNTREVEYRDNKHKTVGFFQKDGRFDYVCDRPWKYNERLRQYKQVMSPDLSCYTDMPVIEQWVNVYTNRLVGAYWQYCGLTVIPTVSWSNEASFDFCFSGIECGSIVAVSTLGTKTTETAQSSFMAGFQEMCGILKPELVICYCSPYSQMYNYAEILAVKHEGKDAARQARRRPLAGQLSIVNW